MYMLNAEVPEFDPNHSMIPLALYRETTEYRAWNILIDYILV